MSGIQNIKDLFLERGREVLDLLLKSKRVIVYEQLDGLNLSCVITENGLEFYKKNRNTKIGDVERTLTGMYERPIEYLNNVEFLKNQLYDGYCFSFFYFPSLKPNLLSYDQVPQNNLILNYVETKHGEKLLDKELLDFFAETLEIGKPPIIFDGKLTSEQVEKVFKFLETPPSKFGKLNFAAEFLKILTNNPKLTLNNNLASAIEGLIFRFEDDKRVATTLKLYDPYFEELINLTKNKKTVDDTYYLILSDIVDFILTQDLKSIQLKERSFEERYVEILCELFNKYIIQKKPDYDSFEIVLPEYLNKSFNDINYDRIKNQETLEIVLTSQNLKEVLRIMLAAFRKRRTKTNSIFTSSLNKIFNNVLDSIIDIIIGTMTEEDFLNLQQNESFITFGQWHDINVKGKDSKEVLDMDVDLDTYLRSQPDYIKNFIETDFSPGKFLKSVTVETESLNPNKRDKRPEVHLIVDSFDPMTNLIYEFINHEYAKNGIPFIPVCVLPRRDFYNQEIMEKIMNSLVSNNPAIIGYHFIDRPNLKRICSFYDEQHHFTKVYSNSKFKKLIEMQIVSNFRDNNFLGLNPDIENSFDYYHNDLSMVGASDRALADGSYSEYKKYVPEEYSILFNELTRLYNYY